MLSDVIFIPFSDKMILALAILQKFTVWPTVSIRCKLQQTMKTSEQNAVFAKSDGDRWRVEIGLHQYDIRWSGRQGRWNLLLWLTSVATVCCLSCL